MNNAIRVVDRTAVQILQTGTFSSWNKGDAAMQISMACALRASIPGCKITISSPFLVQDGPFYQSFAEVICCNRRRPFFSAFQIVRAAIWRLLRNILGIRADWILADAELRATLQADLVIDLSGDMLTDDYGPHVAWSHYIPIILALLLGRPVFLCAQSIGPFRWTGWIARQILNRVDRVTVRDEISFENLAEIRVNAGLVELTSDMAFLMEPASSDRAFAIFATEGIDIGSPSVLGVSLSRILEQRYNSANPQSCISFVQLIAKALDDFAIENHADTLFVPHVTGPSAEKDDRRIAFEVASLMKTPAKIIKGNYRPEELKAIIGCCSMLLGARMHANIAALSTGIPVIALSYSHKTPGIMALFGQSAQVIDGKLISNSILKQRLNECWQQRDSLAKSIRQAFGDLRISSSRNVQLAIDLLPRQSGDNGGGI